MNLPDLKDLKKLVAGLRKLGVKSIRTEDIELTLSDLPVLEPIRRRRKTGKISSEFPPTAEHDDPLAEGELTQEELLYYSVTDGFLDKVGN